VWLGVEEEEWSKRTRLDAWVITRVGHYMVPRLSNSQVSSGKTNTGMPTWSMEIVRHGFVRQSV
jgi:hypothetical protein